MFTKIADYFLVGLYYLSPTTWLYMLSPSYRAQKRYIRHLESTVDDLNEKMEYVDYSSDFSGVDQTLLDKVVEHCNEANRRAGETGKEIKRKIQLSINKE